MKVYRKDFQELKLDYDIDSRGLGYTYHYIESDDCGETEEIDLLQGYTFPDDLILKK